MLNSYEGGNMSQLRIKYLQFIEQCRKDNFFAACGSALGKSLYKSVEFVPAEKDLESLLDIPSPGDDAFEFVEVGPENFSALAFPKVSRYEYAKNYFRKGYRMIAMVHDGIVVGDIWYVDRKMARQRTIHSDLVSFKVELRDDEVYLFDMYLNAGTRGGGQATYFHGSVLKSMRERGFRKAYGSYEIGNIPAMWMHRLIGYRELPHLELRRFFRIVQTVRAKS